MAIEVSSELKAASKVYLASGSPRRSELLAALGVPFSILRVSIDESRLPCEAPANMVVRLACAKAARGRVMAESALPVLGADTVVVQDGEIFGKPQSRAEALDMLQCLSGRTHEVFTGVALDIGGRQMTRTSVTRVRFRTIEPEEAKVYWATGEPADKAGAYAIQGLGGIFVSNIEGSYSGVVGLPIFETAELLRESGAALLSSTDGQLK